MKTRIKNTIFAGSACRLAKASWLITHYVLACLACSSGFLAIDCRAADKPNIVLLLADDAGYADFGFQQSLSGQSTEFKTPNLDALAQQGVRFSNGYVSASVCSPSRAGLLTGRYQQRFGYEFNIGNEDDPNDGMPTDQVMMTERFQQIGYTTGVVGKWHLGLEDAKQPQNQGVDEFFGLWQGSRGYFGVEGEAGRKIRDLNGPRDWTTEASFNDVPVDTGGKGRHVTDAFGDEASRFIASHADDAEPFFLYLPFTSPHSPFSAAKQQDLNEFNGTSLVGERKTIAALTFAMDRAVGSVLNRINDPNGDGDMSDSIADNTIVVFASDNGGTPSHDNGVLAGFKGDAFEGGTRVPFLIRMPDPENPGQFLSGEYANPVSTIDLLPTFIAAAGEEMTTPTDGVDLTPFLTGVQTGAPHEFLAWRKGDTGWAIRKGDWKLFVGEKGEPIRLAQLAADGSGELTDLSDQQPEKRQELVRDFTAWEAEMGKQTQDSRKDSNRFDHFIYRQQQATNGNWDGTNAWQQAGTSNNVSMAPNDAYPNAILEFRPRDDANYVATNNMNRVSGFTYMLNQIRLSGEFSGTTSRSATIDGNDLLFVDDLDGNAPVIRLDATRTTVANFAYNLNSNLILFDDLTISGDSSLQYNINGHISRFYEDRNVTKTGASSVTLTGINDFGGVLDIQQGGVSLADGRITTSKLNIAASASFDFTGGTLAAAAIVGDLVNNGGVFAPGKSPAITTVVGDYTQSAGILEIEINGEVAGVGFDVLQVTGELTAAGTLKVLLPETYVPQFGQEFEVITANSITGNFTLDSPQDLDGEDMFSIHHDPAGITLKVVSALALVDGDMNFDGLIDVADWRILHGNLYKDVSELTLGEARVQGDLNRDLLIDRIDFLLFKDSFNNANGAGSFERLISSVPEPSSLVVMFVACLPFLCRRWPK